MSCTSPKGSFLCQAPNNFCGAAFHLYSNDTLIHWSPSQSRSVRCVLTITCTPAMIYPIYLRTFQPFPCFPYHRNLQSQCRSYQFADFQLLPRRSVLQSCALGSYRVTRPYYRSRCPLEVSSCQLSPNRSVTGRICAYPVARVALWVQVPSLPESNDRGRASDHRTTAQSEYQLYLSGHVLGIQL